MNIWCIRRWILIKSEKNNTQWQRGIWQKTSARVKYPRENWFNLRADFHFFTANEESHFVCIYENFNFLSFIILILFHCHHHHRLSFVFHVRNTTFFNLIIWLWFMKRWGYLSQAKTLSFIHPPPKENFIVIVPADIGIESRKMKSIFILKCSLKD